MKTKSIFKSIFSIVFAVLAVGLFAVSIGIIASIIGGGAVYAMAASSGSTTQQTSTTETMRTGSSELLDNTISQKITEMKPAATPIDTILRMTSKVKCESWEYEWYAVDVRGHEDTLASNFDTSASGTYSSSTDLHTITVTNQHIWNEDDLGCFPEENNDDGYPIVFRVTSLTRASSTLAIQVLNGNGSSGTDLPDMTSGEKIVRLTPAKAELDAQHSPYAIYPAKSSNYCQRIMAQVEQSLYEAIHKKEVDWNINNYRAQSIFDMKIANELNLIMGYKSKIQDPEDGDYIYTSSGLLQYITGSTTYTLGSLANSDLIKLSKDVFKGNVGSDTRYMFVGSGLSEALHNLDIVQKQQEAGSTYQIFGVTFDKIRTNFGTLMIMYHQLFDWIGFTNKGLVLDFAHIERPVWKPMEVRKLDLVTSGQRNANAFVMEETATLSVRYPATHRIFQPA